MDKNELTAHDIKLNELLKQMYGGIFFEHLKNELEETKRVGDTVMYMAVAGYYPSIDLIEKMKENDNANIVFKLFRELELDEQKRTECDITYKAMLATDSNNVLAVVNDRFMENLVEDVKGFIQTGEWTTVKKSNSIFSFTENLNFSYMSLIEQAIRDRNEIKYISPEQLKNIVKELINDYGLMNDEVRTAVIGFNILENEMQLSNDELLKIENLKEQFEKIEILDIKDNRLDVISQYIKTVQQYINICQAMEDHINAGSIEKAMGFLEEFQTSYKKQINLVEDYYTEKQIYDDLCEMYKEFYPDLAEELIIPDTYEFEKNILNATTLNAKARDIFESIAKGFKDKTTKAEIDYNDIEANKDEILKNKKLEATKNGQSFTDNKKIQEEMKILMQQAEMVAQKTKLVEETFIKKAYEPMMLSFDENERKTQSKLELISKQFDSKDKIVNDTEKNNIKVILDKATLILGKGIDYYLDVATCKKFEDVIKTKLENLLEEFQETKKIGNETPEVKFNKICQITDLEERKLALQNAENEYNENINKMNVELKDLLKQSLMKPSKENMNKINKLKEYIQKTTSDKIVFEEYKQKELSNIEREISKSVNGIPENNIEYADDLEISQEKNIGNIEISEPENNLNDSR
jgi:hypothetical protein